MNLTILILSLIAASALPTPTASALPRPTPVSPMFIYSTPAPLPTPVGSLLISDNPTHGIPVVIGEQELNAPIYVNGNFLGSTNNSNSFTITFPNPGTYALDVGDYPEQILVVN